MTNTLRASGLAALLGPLLLAACAAAPTPYTAAPTEDAYGYTQEQQADGSWRVGFRGNPATSEDDVKMAVLRRMAEIASDEGADRFTVIEQRADCVTTLRVSPTTSCTVRQSADAMFPYYFAEYENGAWWRAAPQREYEAVAFMRPGGGEDCLSENGCHLVADVEAQLAEG